LTIFKGAIVAAGKHEKPAATFVSIQHVSCQVTTAVCKAQSCITAAITALVCIHCSDGTVFGHIEQYTAITTVLGNDPVYGNTVNTISLKSVTSTVFKPAILNIEVRDPVFVRAARMAIHP
jgi:hypothetical protein